MQYLLIILFIHSLLLSGYCQDEDIFSKVQGKSESGEVIIRQDSSIKNLVNKYAGYCQTAKGFPGYRIRIFSNSGNNARIQAKNVKSKFETAHPDFESYLVYNNPNFEIFVGDFRTKSETLKLLKSLAEEYPSAFIVKSLIKFPK